MAATVYSRSITRLLTKRNLTRNKNKRFVCTNPPAPSSPRWRNVFKSDGQYVSRPVDGLGTFSWLSQYGPQFHLKGEQVQVISEPAQFYEVLKLKSRKAKKRITFASLYLGNGDLEKDLVSCIREACLSSVVTSNPNFEVNILLDFTRGSRGKRNSRSMLRPLMAEFNNVNVSLYHTPDLRGLLKWIIPERFNETIGLTHVKVYLFDDSFIISGANLSNDYFTARQDRYILFNDCPELADFFNNFVKTIMSFSFSLSADDSLHLAPGWTHHPYKSFDGGQQFKMSAREKIEACLDISDNPKLEVENSADTVIYPLVQMGPFNVTHDSQAMLGLLRSSTPQDHILLASGYFNLTDHYMSVILDQSVGKFSILMASPQANGFLGAKGIAGAIPYSYIYLAHQFYKRVCSRCQTQRIHLMEYVREGWTFHGKGLWYYLPSQPLPTLTLVGSPNFGHRSVYRDLECQVAIVTENKHLQEQLREEHVRMYSTSQPVTESTFERRDRFVPLWIRFVTKIIKNFF
ncbi:CDP-diacylglycerol--glycerol-3-phosphate 3-phosphatidyltransferase, mitochondrial-like [Physella acuta]|uniref:CDP-diacylglycerol--glycerol-3-phosphate 3-phosphatidyltransferase, mitochondrial-like n=1 Tax=Physella acuta TaxID=109671 RepID=UPI0027DCC027|nr:CDP-diacylglycerol--glycerol-3-phosphate 3-phosphatidyltransferase, mitochondrial-like [Physella acuta]